MDVPQGVPQEHFLDYSSLPGARSLVLADLVINESQAGWRGTKSICCSLTGCVDLETARRRGIMNPFVSLNESYSKAIAILGFATLRNPYIPLHKALVFPPQLESPLNLLTERFLDESPLRLREVKCLYECQRRGEEMDEMTRTKSFYEVLHSEQHHGDIDSKKHWSRGLQTNTSFLSSPEQFRSVLCHHQKLQISTSTSLSSKDSPARSARILDSDHQLKCNTIETTHGRFQPDRSDDGTEKHSKQEASRCSVRQGPPQSMPHILGPTASLSATFLNTVVSKRLASASRKPLPQVCLEGEDNSKVEFKSIPPPDEHLDDSSCRNEDPRQDSKIWWCSPLDSSNVHSNDAAQILLQLGSSIRRHEDPYFDISELNTPIMPPLTTMCPADSKLPRRGDKQWCGDKKYSSCGQHSSTEVFCVSPVKHRTGLHETFPEKLHLMLEDMEKVGTCDIVGFLKHGRAFMVHDVHRFVSETLPNYFNQSKWNSFQRQLNLYGFQRIQSGPDKGGYYHELFLKGIPHLCSHMRRVGAPIGGGVDRRKTRRIRKDICDPDFYSMKPLTAGVLSGSDFSPPNESKQQDTCFLDWEK